MLTTVFIRLPSSFSSLHIRVPAGSTLADLPLPCTDDQAYLRTAASAPLPWTTPLAALGAGDHPVCLSYGARMLGGKGGFGSQLRAAGGRMSSGKASNNDSCRDLNGRRLATVKEAQKLADYVELSAAREKAESDATRAKLAALERTLGISSDTPGSSGSNAEASGSKRKQDDLAEFAMKKKKFEDTEYLEQSREINDNVRSAVSAGLLKKRKAKAAAGKAATEPAKAPAATTATLPTSTPAPTTPTATVSASA